MTSVGPELHSAPAGSVHIVAWGPNGEHFVRRLQEGENLLVGRDRTCSLRLEGEGVASLHCSLSLREGGVFVQDWYSDSGTLINGERIESQAPLPQGAELEVGSFRVAVEGGPQAPAAPAAQVTAASQSAASPQDEPAAAPVEDTAPAAEPTEPGTPNAESEAEIDRLQEELREARAERDRLREELQTAAARPEAPPMDPGYEFDAFQQEAVPDLQAEIETLQSELAERDARLAELSAWEAGEPPQPDGATEDTAAETAALADRLEQLLDELDRSDQRISELEDLLRLAEDAKRAEQEERRQLETWVGDIEHRVAQWESEWKAEIEALQQQIEQLTAQRDQAEQRLQQMAGRAPSGSSADDGLLDSLRQRNADLEERLEESQRRRRNLEQRVDELEKKTAAQPEAPESGFSREEQVEIAQERAALARERAELTRLKDELNEQAGKVRNSSDARLRAFREHLKEIHQQEQQQRAERSLSSRLGRLWKRLEGRPG